MKVGHSTYAPPPPAADALEQRAPSHKEDKAIEAWKAELAKRDPKERKACTPMPAIKGKGKPADLSGVTIRRVKDGKAAGLEKPEMRARTEFGTDARLPTGKTPAIKPNSLTALVAGINKAFK